MPPVCPRPDNMRLSVVFLRMLFGNNRNVVTSLVAAPNSPVTVRSCCGGANTKTGDLEVDVNLQLTAVGPINGAKALKTIDGGNTFKYGWVTEGIVSGSNEITVQGYKGDSAQRELTAIEKETLGFSAADTIYASQGLVKITYNDALTERELSPQIIRLSDVAERLYRDVPYLGFPSGQDSLIRLRFIVPAAGLGTGVQMQLRAQLLGLVAGQFPDLNVTYRRLPRPTAGLGQLPIIPLATENAEQTLGFPSGVGVTANAVAEIESAVFPVVPGDTVLMTIRRPLIGGGSDAYAGEVGLLRVSGIITNT